MHSCIRSGKGQSWSSAFDWVAFAENTGGTDSRGQQRERGAEQLEILLSCARWSRLFIHCPLPRSRCCCVKVRHCTRASIMMLRYSTGSSSVLASPLLLLLSAQRERGRDWTNSNSATRAAMATVFHPARWDCCCRSLARFWSSSSSSLHHPHLGFAAGWSRTAAARASPLEPTHESHEFDRQRRGAHSEQSTERTPSKWRRRGRSRASGSGGRASERESEASGNTTTPERLAACTRLSQ